MPVELAAAEEVLETLELEAAVEEEVVVVYAARLELGDEAYVASVVATELELVLAGATYVEVELVLAGATYAEVENEETPDAEELEGVLDEECLQYWLSAVT